MLGPARSKVSRGAYVADVLEGGETEGGQVIGQGLSNAGCVPAVHLGNEEQLLFDAQEDGIESQLMGLLVKPSQGCSRCRQQVVVTRPFFLEGIKYFH